MRKTTRDFVLSLKGPKCLYCNCFPLCSKVEIDHIVPVSFLRNVSSNKCLDDPHNLYPCCSFLNQRKGSSLIVIDNHFIGNEISGVVARTYMYMQWKYNIFFPHKMLSHLRSMSLLHKPFEFEKERSIEIRNKYNLVNPFIEKYPNILFTKD